MAQITKTSRVTLTSFLMRYSKKTLIDLLIDAYLHLANREKDISSKVAELMQLIEQEEEHMGYIWQDMSNYFDFSDEA